MHLQEDELKDVLLVILANKQDIEGAMSPSEVSNQLGLNTKAVNKHKYQIFKTSAIKGDGLDESMEW